MTYSTERDELITILRNNGVDSLWHFTDIRNMPLIKKYNGLKSKAFLEADGMLGEVFMAGNQLSHELDKSIGNWDKICLNFTPRTPMVYHKKRSQHLVFIEIDSQAATLDGVTFTDCNAVRTRNGQNRAEGVQGLSQVRFDIIKGPIEPWSQDWKKFVQAEVLIPDCLPIQYFKSIHFNGNASKELGTHYWTADSPIFSVNKNPFMDVVANGKGTVEFAHVTDVFAVTNQVTEKNVDQITQGVMQVPRNSPAWLVIRLVATAGTVGKIEVIETGQIEKMNFETDSSWTWWPKINVPSNSSRLETDIYLNDILWAKRKLTVR
jgi:hypothetical protein